eukprot:CAMPEP_0198128136 /NCGR_PEP_ID=MMETSP1442-20131203/48644_1 /TAXON_ID= /ORGANISM="Craspedostauros australis, Strain CCMP3328" /LENGTH=60 /DNA_ID=CAMNT_0043788237 /DNA_START=377 /DNA_END=559 /DNA_ORIENTATION=-
MTHASWQHPALCSRGERLRNEALEETHNLCPEESTAGCWSRMVELSTMVSGEYEYDACTY